MREPAGARPMLAMPGQIFGNSIAGDEGWTEAKNLVKSQQGLGGATVEETDTSIVITQPNGRGYLNRQRFDNQYCEFSVSAVADRSDDILALWKQVGATIAPVSQ